MTYDDSFTAFDTRTGKRATLIKRALLPTATVAATVKAWPNPTSFNAVLARMEAEELAKAMADDDGDHDAGDRGDGGGGASKHALSRLADLTVESGKFSSRGEALNWLISHP